jgi:hypothetical protein
VLATQLDLALGGPVAPAAERDAVGVGVLQQRLQPGGERRVDPDAADARGRDAGEGGRLESGERVELPQLLLHPSQLLLDPPSLLLGLAQLLRDRAVHVGLQHRQPRGDVGPGRLDHGERALVHRRPLLGGGEAGGDRGGPGSGVLHDGVRMGQALTGQRDRDLEPISHQVIVVGLGREQHLGAQIARGRGGAAQHLGQHVGVGRADVGRDRRLGHVGAVAGELRGA